MNKLRNLSVGLAMAAAPLANAQEKVNMNGLEMTTNSTMPQIGTLAPDFTGTDKDLKEVSLSSFRGKNVILNIFPSLDTPTCAMSVRHFNESAAALDNTVVLCLSKDLPFAQSRFCTVEGIQNVHPLSLFRSESFDQNYGLILTDGPLKGLAARAVFVLDPEGKIIYSQLVKNITEEPDYDQAIQSIR